MFEDDPMEFIRQDLEASTGETPTLDVECKLVLNLSPCRA
jgi:hypothetical protein